MSHQSRYFNQQFLINLLFLIVIFVISDLVLFNWFDDVVASLWSFRIKLMLVVFYYWYDGESSGADLLQLASERKGNTAAVSHVAVFLLAIWLAVVNLITETTLSSYTGIALIFGGIAYFQFMIKTQQYCYKAFKNRPLLIFSLDQSMALILALFLRGQRQIAYFVCDGMAELI